MGSFDYSVKILFGLPSSRKPTIMLMTGAEVRTWLYSIHLFYCKSTGNFESRISMGITQISQLIHKLFEASKPLWLSMKYVVLLNLR